MKPEELDAIQARAYELGPDDGDLGRLCHYDVPRLVAVVREQQQQNLDRLNGGE